MQRSEALNTIRSREAPWDVVIIGGGATGAGCALDAALRGLDVLLVERHDFGKGTSSRSTKLIHGGVRYLREFDIALVREALSEREILLRNAPHVVRKQAFVIPCSSLGQKLYYGLGLKLYDLLAGRNSFGRSEMLSRDKISAVLPTIDTSMLAGGIRYYDGQFNDTRLLIDILRAAYAQGATVANYTAVEGIRIEESGCQVLIKDVFTGESFEVSARSVINAAGVFCDEVRRLADISSRPLVRLSQGIHIVLNGAFLDSEHAILVPETADGRVIFCIPWQGVTLLGTTETPVKGASDEPRALEQEIDFLLDAAGSILKSAPSRSDIKSVFAGLRPLVDDSSARATATLSRGAIIARDRGFITVTGGKWTTYRRMAEQAVDAVFEVLGVEPAACDTKDLTITGPERGDGELLHPDHEYTTGDVVRAVRSEMAQTIEDVLARRTRMLFIDAAAAIACAPVVARIIEGEINDFDAQEDLERFRSLAAGYLPAPNK